MKRLPIASDPDSDPRTQPGWAGGVEQARKEALVLGERVQALGEARLAGRQTELERLTKKHGAGHPRVRRLASELAEATVAHEAVKLGVGRARPLVDVAPVPGVWVVHGYVVVREGALPEGLTVKLVSAADRAVPGVATADVADDGYFRITIRAGATSGRLFDEPSSAAPDPVIGAATSRAYHLRVVDKQGREVASDDQQLHPAVGQVELRILTIQRNG